MFDDATWAALNEDWAKRKAKKNVVSSSTGPRKKTFLQDQISTGGGVAGALGGAAGGAAIGSVVPIVGTAVGGLLGAIIGGGLGSAGGEALENFQTGDDLSKNVLKEGLIGGVTSLPVGAGLKLARAGVKASTGVGKVAAGDLVQEAGVQSIGRGTVAKTGRFGTEFDADAMAALQRMKGGARLNAGATGEPLKSTLTGKLAASGDKALASQYGTLSKPTIRQTDPATTVKALADMGITRPADAERIASQITGSDGILTRQVADAVGGASTVDTSSLRRVFNDALDNYGIVDKDRKSLTTLFDAQMNKLSGGARGSLDPKVNPTDALATMKSFEKRIANLRGKGGNYRMSTPEREDMANALQLVKDEMEDSLYRGAGANQNLGNLLTPELRERLVSLHPNNAQWAKHVDDNIMTASDVGSIRSAQSPFVNIGKIIEEGEDNLFSAGGRMVTSANGIKGAILEGAQTLIKNPAARAYAAGTRAVSGTGARAAGPVGQTLLGAATRQGIGRLATAEPTQPEPLALADQELPIDPSSLEEPMLEEPTNPFGVSSDQVAQLMMVALQNGDSKGYAQLKDLYDMVGEYEAAQAPGGGKQSAAASKAATQAANGEAAIDELEALLAQAGGGSGAAGGRVKGILGAIDVDQNAKLYNDSLGGYVDLIAKARGKTDALSEADRELIMNSLPRITDTRENAAKKIAALRRSMQVARQNALLYGGAAEEPAPTF